MTVGHRVSQKTFQFRDWTSFCMWLEASPFIAPGACFMAGLLLSYRCGSDSLNLSKCSELLPVQVPIRVLALEESTNQMKLTLLFTQM